jgi:hypothetical protein
MRHRTLSDILREVDIPPQLQDRLARVVYGLGGGRVPFVFSNAIVGSPAAAGETAICTTPPFNPPGDGAFIFVFGYCALTVGTNGININTRIRQGSGIAGLTIAAFNTVTAAAGNAVAGVSMGIDTTAGQAGVQYTLTVGVASATAVSTVQVAFLIAVGLG